MDPALDKRLKFRETIRRKQIEEIKKSKRQLFDKQIKRNIQQKQEEKLYLRVIHDSHQLFQQKQNYLQLLRQALHWERINNFKSLLPEVLLNLIKFYEENAVSQKVLILLIECLAMIFCETTIQFDELTKRCLSICVQYFNKNKVGEGEQKLIRNRCLVAICNITSTFNKQILHFCESVSLLENLQDFLHDFPVEDENKINILSIYGNLINYHLSYSYGQSIELGYHPFLLKHCVEENYNSEVLNKATEAVTNLLKIDTLDRLDILENMDCLFFNILSAGYYIEATQDLLDATLEYFASSFDIEIENFDINSLFPKLFSILEMLQEKFSQKVQSPAAMARSYFWMAVNSHKYYEYSEDQKLEQLTRSLCNFWVDLEDDTSNEFEVYFMKFLRFSLSNMNVLRALHDEWEREIQEDNAIRAPTWEIVCQFLKSSKIDDSEIILEFLRVLQIQNMAQMIPNQYRDALYEKIEGCYYSQIGNSQICSLADEVLKKYQMQSK